MIRHVKHPFPPVIDENCTTLILGSVPSVKSVEYDFYYMHPQNRFWRVLSLIYGVDLYGASVEERKKFLLAHHIAMYDSVEECDINASKDTDIKNVVPADISALMQISKINRILCNGKASYNYFVKYNPALAPIATSLPSTSPANAQFSLERLVKEWGNALKN